MLICRRAMISSELCFHVIDRTGLYIIKCSKFHDTGIDARQRLVHVREGLEYTHGSTYNPYLAPRIIISLEQRSLCLTI